MDPILLGMIKKASSPSDSQVASAVNSYLAKNPVQAYDDTAVKERLTEVEDYVIVPATFNRKGFVNYQGIIKIKDATYDFRRTGYIRVKGLKRIVGKLAPNPNIKAIAYYDSEYKFISGHPAEGSDPNYLYDNEYTESDIPSNAYYVIFVTNNIDGYYLDLYYDKSTYYSTSESKDGSNLLLDSMKGYYIPDNKVIGDTLDIEPTVYPIFNCISIDCKTGDTFSIKGVGYDSARVWCFVDENNKVLSIQNYKTWERSYEYDIVAPVNASKLVVNVRNDMSDNPYLIKKESTLLSNNNTSKRAENDLFLALNRDIKKTPSDFMYDYINGLKFEHEVKTPLTTFAKSGDLMLHSPSFVIVNDIVYASCYVNTRSAGEVPTEHTARFLHFSLNDMSNKTYIDVCDVGETFDGKTVNAIYDVVTFKKNDDDDNLYILWTAKLDNIWYVLYRVYNITSGTLGNTNYCNITAYGNTNVYSTSGIRNSFLANGIDIPKSEHSDIVIMQQLTSRTENGDVYYYTGFGISGFNYIAKSKDLINWEYVSHPDFYNDGRYEPAVYVKGDYAYYYCRQATSNTCGFLTRYRLNNGEWEKPILLSDGQSRSCFFEYNGYLYLIRSAVDRNHFTITQINTSNLINSKDVQTADADSLFYPYVRIYNDTIYLSYCKNRQDINFCSFTIGNYSNSTIKQAFKNLFSI